jgi:HlyD family secretion protein
MSMGQTRRVQTTVSSIRDTSAQDRPLRPSPGYRRWALLAISGAVAAAALALLAPGLGQFMAAERSVPRERLRVAPVTRKAFVRDLSVRGRVVAAVKPTVYAPSRGTVTLLVKAGDTVQAGQLLAQVHSPELTSELAQERSTLQRIETDLARQDIDRRKQELKNQQTVDLAKVAITAARRELARAETSWEQRIISLQDYEAARDELARAELEYEHARENLSLESESLAFDLQTGGLERDRQRMVVEELERRVAGLALRSPVSGMIGDLAAEQKSAVAENQPLMTVVDLTGFEIEIQVPQEYADDLALGMPAQISFGGYTHAGTLTAVSPEVSENQVKGRVRFDEPVPSGLRQNQRVSARMVLESIDSALTIRRGPFLDSGSGRVAYVVEGDTASRRSIRTGAASVAEVEILEGLREGESVVISDLAQFEGAASILLTD